MTRFFIEGNIVFMSTMTVLFLIMLILSVIAGIKAFSPGADNSPFVTRSIKQIKSVALFTLVFGIFCQVLGIADVLNYLADQKVDVAASVIAKGIKITFHTTIYGMLIFLLSIVISTGLRLRIRSYN